ncbi:hypothetical protein BDR05DRAFT_1018030 [Suillus weaverae]|nr:hypothetical protein BDR05DRAFT_1018030 [Suillus weaverae]
MTHICIVGKSLANGIGVARSLTLETPDDILETSASSNIEPATEEAKLDRVKDEWDNNQKSKWAFKSTRIHPTQRKQIQGQCRRMRVGMGACKHAAATTVHSKDNLRSPMCCILGHVDTCKTKLLDEISQTNVQEGEAGGITQQIGATYFPLDAIKTKTAVMNKADNSQEYKIPGVFVTDTLGHDGSVQREFMYKKTFLPWLNAVLYYENKSFARNGSPVPPSAITGEGVPDMIMLLVNLYQQRIIVCGLNGPMVTQVRALLTPQPLRKLRIESAYVHHKEVKAALGVKLIALTHQPCREACLQ